MALALRISDLNEDTFAMSAVATKACSGCDPDVPGHCDQRRCLKCRGTGQEPMSFRSTVAELVTSKKESLLDIGGKTKKKFSRGGGTRDTDYTTGDDDAQNDFEY